MVRGSVDSGGYIVLNDDLGYGTIYGPDYPGELSQDAQRHDQHRLELSCSPPDRPMSTGKQGQSPPPVETPA